MESQAAAPDADAVAVVLDTAEAAIPMHRFKGVLKVVSVAKELANSVVAETTTNMETDFLLSRFIYLATSTPTEAQRATRKSLATLEAMGDGSVDGGGFAAIDVNNDGLLDRDEVIAAAPRFNMSKEQASELFDRLDLNGDGVLTRQVGRGVFTHLPISTNF